MAQPLSPPPFKIRLQWHDDTLAKFKQYDINLAFEDSIEVLLPCTVGDVAEHIEGLWESAYEDHFKENAQMNINYIAAAQLPGKGLPFDDSLTQHIASGDRVLLRATIQTTSTVRREQMMIRMMNALAREIAAGRESLGAGISAEDAGVHDDGQSHGSGHSHGDEHSVHCRPADAGGSLEALWGFGGWSSSRDCDCGEEHGDGDCDLDHCSWIVSGGHGNGTGHTTDSSSLWDDI